MRPSSTFIARLHDRIGDRTWHQRVWRLTWPVILSGLSAPMVGIADTAVMGRMPNADFIAAVALGAMVLSAFFWLFGFLRMGTTALTAQALGADRPAEILATYLRGCLLALAVAALLVLVGLVALPDAVARLGADSGVTRLTADYLQIRLWGAPAYLLHLVQLGALFGMQRMGTALVLTLAFNLLNLSLDIFLALGLGWGVAGVAWGTVISEWVVCGAGAWVLWRLVPVTAVGRSLGAAGAWWHLLGISRDLMLRTFFVQLPFLLNTLLAGRLGATVLAGNAILMNFFFLISHALDGYAHSAEALTGHAVGRRSRADLTATFRYSATGAALFAVLLTLLFGVAREPLLGLMTNLPEVADSARQYYPYLYLMPLLGIWAFLLDGVFIGATAMRELRNAMMIAASAYLLTVWIAFEALGNHALWTALLVFMALRGLLLGYGYPRLVQRVVPLPAD